MNPVLTLPTRQGSAPKIGQHPPQLQFSDFGSDEIKAALKDWTFSAFPHVREHDTHNAYASSS